MYKEEPLFTQRVVTEVLPNIMFRMKPEGTKGSRVYQVGKWGKFLSNFF